MRFLELSRDPCQSGMEKLMGFEVSLRRAANQPGILVNHSVQLSLPRKIFIGPPLHESLSCLLGDAVLQGLRRQNWRQPGAVARLVVMLLGMQVVPRSIPASSTILCEDLVMKIF